MNVYLSLDGGKNVRYTLILAISCNLSLSDIKKYCKLYLKRQLNDISKNEY